MVAFDKSEPKVAKLRTNCARLGIHSVKAFVFDGIKALDPDKQWDPENSEWINNYSIYGSLYLNCL